MIKKLFTTPLCLLGSLALLASPVTAQVFESGPSDPALFDNVFNLPPDPDIANNQTIGGNGLTTQLNLQDGGSIGSFAEVALGSEVNIGGGSIGSFFTPTSGSEVNIRGGSIDSFFTANSGSEINMSGGSIDSFFTAASGSDVTISGGSIDDFFTAELGSDVSISGGTFGDIFEADAGSNVEMIGGDFRLNGFAFSGPTISTQPGDVFTGTLADGSTFIIADRNNIVSPSGQVRGGSLSNVTLTSIQLPAADLSPLVVSTAFPTIPSGLRAGQTLTLLDGGELPANFEVVDASLNIEGGRLGNSAGAANSIVNISGGSIGGRFIASNSVMTISGGFVGREFGANVDSVVTISGGRISSSFRANPNSTVDIRGGSFGGNFTAFPDSAVTISGGTLGSGFEAQAGSNVELFGGEFQLNGVPHLDATISITPGDVFTGTLADGSKFIFSRGSLRAFEDDILSNVELTSTPLPALDLSPLVVSVANPNLPSGLRAGQTLTLVDGGELGSNFEVVDATLNVEGGSLRGGGGAVNSIVNIRGGVVSGVFTAGFRSEVNFSDGRLVGSFTANSESVVNISGGAIVGGFTANLGSVVNISGGASPRRSITARSGSQVNIFGSDFVLDGEPLDGSLVNDQAFTILDRDVRLSGLLADGSPFSFEIEEESFSPFGNNFDPDAILTVTLVSPVLLGDCDQNGVVDFQDINPFIGFLASNTFLEQADCNEDGLVNFLDISPFIAILATQ